MRTLFFQLHKLRCPSAIWQSGVLSKHAQCIIDPSGSLFTIDVDNIDFFVSTRRRTGGSANAVADLGGRRAGGLCDLFGEGQKFLSEAEHSSIDLLKVRYLLHRAGALFVCEQATIVSMRQCIG